MWDKIKGWLAVAGGFLVTALGFLAYIFMLKRENTELKDSIAVEKAKEELGKVLVEKDEATKVADGADVDYQSVRDAFLRATNVSGSDSGSGQGPSSKG